MVRVKLVSWNTGYPLSILAIKTSAGKVREKGYKYYLEDYPLEKKEEMMSWIEKASKHFPTVLEHIVLTFMIEDVSRTLTHQLVRHRLASFTQESQRYSIAFGTRKEMQEIMEKLGNLKQELSINDSLDKIVEEMEKHLVIPETIKRDEKRLRVYLESTLLSLESYLKLFSQGVPYEDARYLLPQAMKSRLMMTVNLRELLHIIKLRGSPQAQWEIRELARQLLQEAKKALPGIEKLL